MSITLQYQNVADEALGNRTLQGAEPFIDNVLRTTSYSAQAAFLPPLKFVTSIFIGNYRDEFQRARHKAPYIAYISATPKTASRALTKFQADLWCEYIYSEQRSIASLFSGLPATSLPGELKIGEVRFDWIPEDAYIEIILPVAQDQPEENFEAACRSVDSLLASKWDAVEDLSSAVTPSRSTPPESVQSAERIDHGKTANGPSVRLPSEQHLRELFKTRTDFQEETAEALTALFIDDLDGEPISPQRALLAILKETRSAMSFYSCFISYSTRDQEFAARLYADLQNKGVRCWFAPHDVRGGKKLHQQIEKAIHLNDRLLLILSEHSMSSRWVKSEIAHARQKELAEERQVLFPVGLVPYERIRQWKLFDADIGDDSAREVREYFIPDFSNWKNLDSYRKAFESLVKGLAVDQKDKL
jgi:TIR domain-containing protein